MILISVYEYTGAFSGTLRDRSASKQLIDLRCLAVHCIKLQCTIALERITVLLLIAPPCSRLWCIRVHWVNYSVLWQRSVKMTFCNFSTFVEQSHSLQIYKFGIGMKCQDQITTNIFRSLERRPRKEALNKKGMSIISLSCWLIVKHNLELKTIHQLFQSQKIPQRTKQLSGKTKICVKQQFQYFSSYPSV